MSDAPRRAAAFTATNVAAETGADELPLIAVSAGNFNTASAKGYVSPVASLVLHDTKCLVFCAMLIRRKTRFSAHSRRSAQRNFRYFGTLEHFAHEMLYGVEQGGKPFLLSVSVRRKSGAAAQPPRAGRSHVFGEVILTLNATYPMSYRAGKGSGKL